MVVPAEGRAEGDPEAQDAGQRGGPEGEQTAAASRCAPKAHDLDRDEGKDAGREIEEHSPEGGEKEEERQAHRASGVERQRAAEELEVERRGERRRTTPASGPRGRRSGPLACGRRPGLPSHPVPREQGRLVDSGRSGGPGRSHRQVDIQPPGLREVADGLVAGLVADRETDVESPRRLARRKVERHVHHGGARVGEHLQRTARVAHRHLDGLRPLERLHPKAVRLRDDPDVGRDRGHVAERRREDRVGGPGVKARLVLEDHRYRYSVPRPDRRAGRHGSDADRGGRAPWCLLTVGGSGCRPRDRESGEHHAHDRAKEPRLTAAGPPGPLSHGSSRR